jgi:DNA-binding SARP family transcriptional activator
MPESGSTNDRSARGWADWRQACELLKAGQYEQVGELLSEVQATSQQSGDAGLAQILAAARRICLACSQSQAESEWHEHARQQADQRGRELRQQLQAIFDLVNGGEIPDVQEAREASHTLITEPSLSERNTFASRLRQRVRNYLAQVRGSQPVEPDTAPASVIPSAPRLAEATKSSAVLSGTLKPVLSGMTPPSREEQKERAFPTLVIYCLGPFRVYLDDQPIEDWPNSKGKSIFKYLVAHCERPVAKEVLMEVFWPGAHPDAARNNLNVAIYSLRQALRQEKQTSFSHIIFQDDCYLLNPDLQTWVDYQAFVEHLESAQALDRHGELVAAIREYRAAEALYQGEFLEDDRYEDWLVPQRQSLQDQCLSLLDRLSRYYLNKEDYATCAMVCGKMLSIDPCREEAHRRLMRCYSRQDQHYLAVRQYHLCVERLKQELDVAPAPGTTHLYERIHRGDSV